MPLKKNNFFLNFPAPVAFFFFFFSGLMAVGTSPSEKISLMALHGGGGGSLMALPYKKKFAAFLMRIRCRFRGVIRGKTMAGHHNRSFQKLEFLQDVSTTGWVKS